MTRSPRFTPIAPRYVAWLLHTTMYLYSIQAHIKLESYGYAVGDADKAIALDANNVKVAFSYDFQLVPGLL